MKFSFFLVMSSVLITSSLSAQKRIALTFDDAPFNASSAIESTAERVQTNLDWINVLKTNPVPLTVFFTTGAGVQDTTQACMLIQQWVTLPLLQAANHSHSHLNHAGRPIEILEAELTRAHGILQRCIPEYSAHWFRFPYNALGNDADEHAEKENLLRTLGYSIAPFSFESVDYAYHTLYADARKRGDADEMRRIQDRFLEHTLQSLQYAERLSERLFSRAIPQIYLGHTHQLHADVMERFLQLFRDQGYEFIPLDEAIADKAWASTVYYQGMWGFSWLYRFMQDAEERTHWLREAPDLSPSDYARYQEISNRN